MPLHLAESALPYGLVARIRLTSPWRSSLGLAENVSGKPFADCVHEPMSSIPAPDPFFLTTLCNRAVWLTISDDDDDDKFRAELETPTLFLLRAPTPHHWQLWAAFIGKTHIFAVRSSNFQCKRPATARPLTYKIAAGSIGGHTKKVRSRQKSLVLSCSWRPNAA